MNLEILLAGGIVLAGSFLQSSFGYGLGVFAAPLLILLNPTWVPAPLLTASLLMTLLISLRELRDLGAPIEKRKKPVSGSTTWQYRLTGGWSMKGN